jgi:hypothetical protein
MCSKAPKPDPNIGAAARDSAQVAADALAWNKMVYEQDAPKRQQEYELAKRFADSSIESQKTNDALAQAYADRMKSTFYPVEDKMVAEASDAGGAGDQEEYANLARGANESALQAQNQQNTRTMQGLGINPNSGANLAMLNTQAIQNAAIQGNAMNQARMAARQLGWAKKSDVANLGRGLPSSQATSAQVALGASNTGLSAGMQPIQASVAQQNARNQGFGVGLQGYNQQGQLGLGSYQGQLQGYNMNNEILGSMIGAGGSLASAAAPGLIAM